VTAAASRPALPAWAVGEFAGTFLLVFFGCGSVAAAVLTGALAGTFQVAVVWGLGIATAIYLTGGLSGAHLNPAVTLAMATVDRLPWRRVPGHLLAQLLGAFSASAVLYAVFFGALRAYEYSNHIVRGAPGSEASAMVFGEFFPNPGGHPLGAGGPTFVSTEAAFCVEALGTAILVLVILCATDARNPSRPGILTAATIGLTVTMLISLFAPLTMAGFNPARDFGPRLFSALAGWGRMVFTVNGSGWLVVYILAPLAGGQAGALAYRFFFRGHYLAIPES
jgi:glycerol uptake facilitator protein